MYEMIQYPSGLLDLVLSPTAFASLTPQLPDMSAEEAIRDYYSLIEQQQYTVAYDILSDGFKSNNVPTLESYITEWEKSGLARIDSPVESADDGNTATVTLTLYFYRVDKQISIRLRYSLFRQSSCVNQRFGCWQILSAQRVELPN